MSKSTHYFVWIYGAAFSFVVGAGLPWAYGPSPALIAAGAALGLSTGYGIWHMLEKPPLIHR